MGITSDRLQELGLIDEIVPEPLGGGHRDPDQTAENLKSAIKRNLEELRRLSFDELLEQRYQRLLGHGIYEEASS